MKIFAAWPGLMAGFLMTCLLSGIGCTREKEAPAPVSPAGAGESGSQSEEALNGVAVEIELPQPQGTLFIQVKIPRGWERSPEFGTVVFQPPDKDDFFYPPLIQYQASCNGTCDPSAIPANIEAALRSLKDTLALPNINTGDPVLDAVRATVDVLREEKAGDGTWILAAAVTYTENLSSALYVPKIVVHAFRHRPGDGFFVQTSAHAPLDQKEKLLDVLIAACRATKH
jgi:hypothetical protein